MRHGRAGPKDPLSRIYESLHDNSITQATLAFLKREKKVAAVMAGHDEPRDSQTLRGDIPHRARCRAMAFS